MEGLPPGVTGSFTSLKDIDPHRTLGRLFFTATQDAKLEDKTITLRASGIGVPDVVLTIDFVVAPRFGGLATR